jgi:2-polyprenyl-6-methoxyphenol hydroxylase-like FAD-dependent oxidoreductase
MALDVIIIGGGVAGTTAALGLRQHGLQVALIESQPVPQWRIGETLAAEARPVLQALGLWEAHLAAGHLPSYGNVSCWGWDAAVDKDFASNLHGHAWQLDRPVFEHTLSHVAQSRGVQRYLGTAVSQIKRHDDHWNVQAGEQCLSAPWLVDASGRRALVARHLEVRRQSLDTLVAIHAIAHTNPATDRDSRTFIESLPHGWFYTALTPGGRRTLSFQTDAALLPPEQQWRSKDWLLQQLSQTRHLGALFESRGCTLTDAPALTSAHSGRLEQFSGPGWLAIGDAAMSFDPITGHGLLKAMQSAMQAVQAIAAGNAEAHAAFDAWNDQLWQQFSQARRQCYATERRWSTAPFWHSRN